MVDELDELQRRERPRVVQEVADAAAQGDRSENAEYIYGKKRLREIDRRVRYLSKRLEANEVVDPRQKHGQRVFFGAWVSVLDEEDREQRFQIVGPDDQTDAEHITYQSPVGRALLGRQLDDEVEVNTPKGLKVLEIIGLNTPHNGYRIPVKASTMKTR